MLQSNATFGERLPLPQGGIKISHSLWLCYFPFSWHHPTHPQTLPFPWKIWPPFAEIGFNGKDFFIPLVSSETLSDLVSIAARSAFVCVPVWPWPLWPGEGTRGSEVQKPDVLHVSVCSRQAFNSETDSFKLAYGGHQYHASCANFWINCVEPKPPGLILPDLLWKAPLWSTSWVWGGHTHGWQGPMNRMQVLQSSPILIYMKNSPTCGCEKSCSNFQSFLQVTFVPRVPLPVFGICGKIALPKLHVGQRSSVVC